MAAKDYSKVLVGHKPSRRRAAGRHTNEEGTKIGGTAMEKYLSHDLSIYLPPCCRERRPLLIKKKFPTFYGPMTRLKFQFGPMATYSGVLGRRPVY